MVDITNNEVLDECDIASAFEENERNISIARILSGVPRNRKIEDIVTIEGLECDICGTVIPIERQRLVLTIKETCEYCVGCQDIMDKQDKLYAQL